ncbi:hypothetical protein ACLOJK_020455 [Asimina triloba]
MPSNLCDQSNFTYLSNSLEKLGATPHPLQFTSWFLSRLKLSRPKQLAISKTSALGRQQLLELKTSSLGQQQRSCWTELPALTRKLASLRDSRFGRRMQPARKAIPLLGPEGDFHLLHGMPERGAVVVEEQEAEYLQIGGVPECHDLVDEIREGGYLLGRRRLAVSVALGFFVARKSIGKEVVVEVQSREVFPSLGEKAGLDGAFGGEEGENAVENRQPERAQPIIGLPSFVGACQLPLFFRRL